ncbi:hypothetical protein R1sor_023218 [Riccia sorocarpa]|uniref:Endonuclease/exonuclease/phosphatase domain-containing protein n=1 Tax=Riccia sorocarpa TaxID=122646 RepID=A0ABD3GP53_9MARC
MSELIGKHGDDCTLSQSLIDQLKKLSVATQEASPSSIVIRKKASSLTLVDKLEQEHRDKVLESKVTRIRDLLPEIFAAIAPVLRISPAAKILAVENPRATLLWDPSRQQPKVVTFEVEEDFAGARSCTLQLPVHFIDLEKSPANLAEEPPSTPTGHPQGPPSVGGLHRASSTSKESSTSSPAQHSSCANVSFGTGSSSKVNGAVREKACWSIVPFTSGAFQGAEFTSWPSQGGFQFPAAPVITEISPEKTPEASGTGSETIQSIRKETHISAARLEFLVNTFTSDYKVLAADSLGQRGGVAFLVHSSCSILDWRAVDYRIIWGHFVVGKVRIPLVNLYSPVESSWEQLISVLPPRMFLVAGDWNVVEQPFDSSSKSNWLSREETVSFFNFKTRFKLADARVLGCEQMGPKHTRTQFRDGRFIWSVLDRFYLPSSLFPNFKLNLIHHPDFPLSDHLSVSLLLSESYCPKPSPNKSVYFKIDPKVLQKPEVKNRIKEIWDTHDAGPCADPVQKYITAWRDVRAFLKEEQYRESQELASLDQKRLVLRNMSTALNFGGGDPTAFLQLTEEVRRLQACRTTT